MDFIDGGLFYGRWIDLLTIVDDFTYEGLAIIVDRRFPFGEVVKAFDQLGLS